ncbi:uncharacterized protein [Antedon mediterranea]
MVIIIGDVSKEIRNYQHEDKGISYSQTSGNQSDKKKIEHLEKKVFELEKDNKKLTEQLGDVITMNTRWQMYDGQREEYVKELTLKLASLQQQLNELGEPKCNEIVEDTNKEKIQALEYQIKTSREDFELERKDRARVQGQLQELKEKVEKAELANKQQKDLIFFYQEQLGELQRGFDQPIRGGGYMRNIYKPRLRNNYYQAYYDDVEADNINGFDVVDLPDSPTNIQNDSKLTSEDLEVDGTDSTEDVADGCVQLQCPKCSKHFTYSEHDKLVEHMDQC